VNRAGSGGQRNPLERDLDGDSGARSLKGMHILK
jgi:hypothetical protein